MAFFETLEAVKSVGSLFLDEGPGKALTIADMLGEGAGAGYDFLTGDSEHGKKHVDNIGKDIFGMMEPFGSTAQKAMDIGDAGESSDEAVHSWFEDTGTEDFGGKGAKWGGMLGMLAMGGLPGLVVGGLAGGYIGDMQNKAESTGVGNNAMAAAMSANPFAHYAD